MLSDGSSTYLYGLGRIGEQQSGGFVYHLTDALGSVRQLVNGAGTVLSTQSYDPYGSVFERNGTGNSTFGFTGEQLDSNGLEYLRARYYNSYLNQWIQPDTIIPNIRNPQTLNRYSYVTNNPINLTDPSGHDPWWCQSGKCREQQDNTVYALFFYEDKLNDTSILGLDCDPWSLVRGYGSGASSIPIAVSFFSPRNLGTGIHVYDFRSFNFMNHTQYEIIDPLRTGKSKNIFKVDLADDFITFDHFNTRGPVFGNNVHIPASSTLVKVGRVVEGAGNVLMVIAIAHDAYYLIQSYQEGNSSGNYTKFTYQTGETAASWAGALAGVPIGASGGATIGTLIFPGPGTIIGGVVGGIVGGIAGSISATEAYDALLTSGGFEVDKYK